jgi:hypothetical protein
MPVPPAFATEAAASAEYAVTGIHVFFLRAAPKKSWMVGLKPTMTILCDAGDGAIPAPRAWCDLNWTSVGQARP